MNCPHTGATTVANRRKRVELRFRLLYRANSVAFLLFLIRQHNIVQERGVQRVGLLVYVRRDVAELPIF